MNFGLYDGNMGEYDGTAIVEPPDEPSVERRRLGFEREGTRHVNHLGASGPRSTST